MAKLTISFDTVTGELELLEDFSAPGFDDFPASRVRSTTRVVTNRKPGVGAEDDRPPSMQPWKVERTIEGVVEERVISLAELLKKCVSSGITIVVVEHTRGYAGQQQEVEKKE